MWKIVWGDSESGEFELQGSRDYIEQQLDMISPLSAINETSVDIRWEKVRLYEKVKGGWQEVIKV